MRKSLLYSPDSSAGAGVAPPPHNEDLSLGSEAGQLPSGAPAPTFDPATQKLTRKINGSEITRTIEEWVTAGMKHVAGEDKLAEAAAYREETNKQFANLQRDAEAAQLLRKADQENDPAAYERAVQLLGLQVPADPGAPSTPEPQDSRNADPSSPQGPVIDNRTLQDVEALKDQVEQQRSYLNAQVEQAQETQLKKTVRELVDSDEKLGIITKRTGPRADYIHEEVWNAVDRRIKEAKLAGPRAQAQLGPHTVTEALAEVRGRMDAAGILTAGVPARVPGLATTPGITAEDFYRDEPPKVAHVADKGKFNASIYDLLKHGLVQASMGQ